MGLKKWIAFLGMATCLFTMNACNGGSGNDSKAGENDEEETSANGSPNADNEKADKENNDAQAKSEETVWVYNERFDFKVKIPEGWNAEDRSDNEDGIFVKTGNSDVDLRVFGEMLNEVTREMEAEDCQNTEPFQFQDGKTGKKCVGEQLVKYYRDKGDERITVYVEAPKEWRKNHREKLENLAKSLSKGGLEG